MYKYFLSRFIHLLILVQCQKSRRDGFQDITLQCRDNDNRPVDWWYMYKQPDQIPADLGGGINFTYMTALEARRWRGTRHSFTGHTMLADTLEPMFKKTYANHLATVIFTNNAESTTAGVLMADEIGAAWISHTVPEFPNMNFSSLYFPPEHLQSGHMFVCLSLSHRQLNKVARAVRRTRPTVVYERFANNQRLRKRLPDLLNLKKPLGASPTVEESTITTHKGVTFTVVTSTPTNKTCLYKTFAMKHLLNIDVFSQLRQSPRPMSPIDASDYSVRTIDACSTKSVREVNYIELRNHAKWAVSFNTPRRKTKSRSYWACTSNQAMTRGKPATAGLLLCVEGYDIWAAFDTLKPNQSLVCPKN